MSPTRARSYALTFGVFYVAAFLVRAVPAKMSVSGDLLAFDWPDEVLRVPVILLTCGASSILR
jgi:hypothetical protein